MSHACRVLFLMLSLTDPAQACTDRNTVESAVQSLTEALQSQACINCGALKPACDLSTQALPKIILFGESHNWPNAETYRDLIVGHGKARKFPVAVEIAEGIAQLPYKRVGDENSLVYGIESPTPYAISVTYLQQNDLLMARYPIAEIFERSVVGVHELPLLRSAYERMMSKEKIGGYSFEFQKLLIQLGRSFEEVEFDPQKDSRNLFKRNYFKATDKQKAQLVTELHKTVVEIANEKYLAYFENEKLEPYLDKLQYGSIFMRTKDTPAGTPKSPFQRVAIDARDRDFAKSVTDLMCVYRGQYDRIAVLVGSEHLEGMARHLSQATGSRVQIEQLVIDPSKPAEIQKALQ